MQENTSVKKRLPYPLRIILCLLIIVICYYLGYGTYYLTKIGEFIAISTGQHLSIKTPTKNNTSIPEQANILLLGSDNDQKFTGNPLTQTMMVVHVDYTKKEVDMFSIPRDLWVRMPGRTTYGKIDQAAEYEGIPSAISVVEQTFGISIDHYAWVGLYGFIKSINAIGGINLQVVHPVLDNSYPTDINNPNPYGYQRLNIQPGMQHLTGEEALQYVRSRHEDLIGDFGRTQRQRQLLLALKQELFSSQTSITQIPSIFDSLNGQIKTDMTPTLGLQFGLFFLTNNITEKQFTLSPPTYSNVGNSTDGQSIVIGTAETSAQLVSSIFGTTAGRTTLDSLSTVQGVQQ